MRLVLIALVAAVLTLAMPASAALETVRRTPCGPVHVDADANSTLHVVGNHMQDSNGRRFDPYGISLVGGPETINWGFNEDSAAAQIVAAHRYWHANTVRIQVSEQQLLEDTTPGFGYAVGFARVVDRLVCRVLRQGDIPVINDTTLFTATELGPTQRSIRFWEYMSRRYGNRFPVIFDLFNEPRLTRDPTTMAWIDPVRAWHLWRDGGTFAGTRYVGMQDLVDTIRRKQHVHNVIWAEEPWFFRAERLQFGLLPHYLLHGRDIMYAFHKATLGKSSPGLHDLVTHARRGIPMVDSEWSQFAADDRPWECYPSAYTRAPRYLKLLGRLNIGLIAWSLQPGSLVRGIPGRDTVNDGNDTRYTTDPRQLAAPSVMKPDYGCTREARGQGTGALVQSYFARHSARPPAGLLPRFG